MSKASPTVSVPAPTPPRPAEARTEKAPSRMKSEDLVRLVRDEADLRIRSRLLENPMEKMTMGDVRLGRAARARTMRERERKQRQWRGG